MAQVKGGSAGSSRRDNHVHSLSTGGDGYLRCCRPVLSGPGLPVSKPPAARPPSAAHKLGKCQLLRGTPSSLQNRGSCGLPPGLFPQQLEPLEESSQPAGLVQAGPA